MTTSEKIIAYDDIFVHTCQCYVIYLDQILIAK